MTADNLSVLKSKMTAVMLGPYKLTAILGLVHSLNIALCGFMKYKKNCHSRAGRNPKKLCNPM